MTTLAFAEGFSDAAYRLIEMDEPLLQASTFPAPLPPARVAAPASPPATPAAPHSQELLSDGGSVCIKGCGEDEAVLTTHDASYVVRLADSSNSMLLVRGGVEVSSTAGSPGGGGGGEENQPPLAVAARAHEHLELVRCAPRLGDVRRRLCACPYGGREAEEALDEPAVGEEEALAPSRPDARPTLSSLEAAAQCSPLELRAALQRWRAVEVAGRWCCLDPQYEADCVECLLALAVEQEWPLHAVPVPAAVEALAAQFDEATVRHCLRSHSTAAAAPWEEWLAAAASDEVALEPRAICTFRARVLLLETEAWPKDAFDEAWADGVPRGIEPSG